MLAGHRRRAPAATLLAWTAAVSVLIVFRSQSTAWRDVWRLYGQDAFLLPVPVLNRGAGPARRRSRHALVVAHEGDGVADADRPGSEHACRDPPVAPHRVVAPGPQRLLHARARVARAGALEHD